MKSGRLSDLQRQILLLALQDNQLHVEAWMVLHRVYGFPLHDTTGVRFNWGEIGLRRYMAATVAVCKSLNRLAVRGFGERVPNRGLFLTPKGLKEAQRIRSESQSG